MSFPIVPQGLIGENWGLATALGLGFLFGFSLERAGFGNARKLAAQFYGYDMSVFKVMFTAVLVAMVGLTTCQAFGLVDLSRVWINPTFLWAQGIGGFLVGIGFAVSGLCPGTSVVAFASGRIDGLLTFVGTFVGTFLFAVMLDRLPGMAALYGAGAQGRSLLPALFGLPAPWLVLMVLLVALGGFAGAEKLEKIFQKRYGRIELSPPAGSRVKFVLVASLAALALVSAFVPRRATLEPAPRAEALEARALAEALIAGDPPLVIIDLRGAEAAGRIPGAQTASAGDEAALIALAQSALPGSTILFVDAEGGSPNLTTAWPAGIDYRFLRGGFAAWSEEVLAPRESESSSDEERDALRRHNEIAAYFSGQEARSAPSAPPPPMPGGGGVKKKAGGGC